MPTDPRHTKPSTNGHADRAARFDTLELEERLRRMEGDQRRARAMIEWELRREHFGRLPEGWHERRQRAA